MAFKWKRFVKNNLLTILLVVGVVSGAIVGCIIRSAGGQWGPRDTMYLRFPGEIFLRMLKSLIIPLLLSSIISAIGSLDLSLSKRIAYRAIAYYSVTTVSAVVMGIILVVTLRPGVGARGYDKEESHNEALSRKVLTQDTLLDLIRNLFPPNLVQACIQQSQTYLIKPDNYTGHEDVSSSELVHWKFKEHFDNNTNVLGLVVFSIVFGISLGRMKEKGKVLVDFFEKFSEAMMIITSWVIWISPAGVFFLIASRMVETDSFWSQLQRLGYYFGTVMLGMCLHAFGTVPIIYFVATRRLPYKFVAQLSQVLATAFATGSSSATIPITLQTLDNLGLDPRVTRFVIPVGATINMDGTALYEAVAAIFIAQLRGREMTFGKTVAVCVTATAASIGAAGIPQAGLVTMVMVLDTVGLPAEDVINILAVDWLLDRFRTTINVMCDSMGAKLVDILSLGELDKITEVDKVNADPQELVEISKEPHN